MVNNKVKTWIHRALKSSIILFVFLIIFFTCVIWYTNLYPLTNVSDELVSARIVESMGIGLFLIIMIWVYEYKKDRVQ